MSRRSEDDLHFLFIFVRFNYTDNDNNNYVSLIIIFVTDGGNKLSHVDYMNLDLWLK